MHPLSGGRRPIPRRYVRVQAPFGGRSEVGEFGVHVGFLCDITYSRSESNLGPVIRIHAVPPKLAIQTGTFGIILCWAINAMFLMRIRARTSSGVMLAPSSV